MTLTNCRPTDNTKLFNKAIDLEEKGNFTESIEVLTKAIEINPKDLECYNNRAWDYLELKMETQALEDFKKMTQIDKDNSAGLYGIAFIHMQNENYDNALRIFNQIIELKGGGSLFLEETDNAFIEQRKKMEANIDQVYYYKRIVEEKLKN